VVGVVGVAGVERAAGLVRAAAEASGDEYERVGMCI